MNYRWRFSCGSNILRICHPDQTAIVTAMPVYLQSLLGIFVFLVLAWALSENRARIPWRTLLAGIGLQIALAAALLWLPPFREIFIALNDLLLSLEEATRTGTGFVFGYLAGDELPFEETGKASTYILAFRALPDTFFR